MGENGSPDLTRLEAGALRDAYAHEFNTGKPVSFTDGKVPAHYMSLVKKGLLTYKDGDTTVSFLTTEEGRKRRQELLGLVC